MLAHVMLARRQAERATTLLFDVSDNLSAIQSVLSEGLLSNRLSYFLADSYFFFPELIAAVQIGICCTERRHFFLPLVPWRLICKIRVCTGGHVQNEIESFVVVAVVIIVTVSSSFFIDAIIGVVVAVVGAVVVAAALVGIVPGNVIVGINVYVYEYV